MEVSGQPHAPAALPRGKNPRYPFHRKLGGPQRRFERGGREKKFQSLPGIEPSSPSPKPSRYTDSVYRGSNHTRLGQNCPCALTERHAMKAYWESGGIAPRILTSALHGDEWLASRPGRFSSLHPLNRRLGGPQSRSGRYNLCDYK
jgi:hypothetical protein